MIKEFNKWKKKQPTGGTLKEAKKFLKDDGKLYISIYNAPKAANYQETDEWVGQPTKKGWQNAQPTDFYVPEVRKVFPSAKKHGGYIVAAK